jgi:hypothetical protein
MNMEKARNDVLLHQSGELSGWGRWRLRRALERSEPLRAYARELDALLRNTRRLPLDRAPSDFSRHRILAEARRSLAPAAARISRPALALAALAILLAIAGWWLWPGRPPHSSPALAQQDDRTPPRATEELAWNNGIETQLAELGSLLASGSLDSGALWDAGTEWNDDAIAEELLKMEGANI